ncbi:MAG TPA: amidase [Noviherbaspirillum sp.]|nr:amidase [Noviherbaspirillum sp.]
MERAILGMDATMLGAKIKDGALSSSNATKAYIEHLQHANQKLNCLVEDRFGAAREEARQADLRRAQGAAEGRLFGVPISVKEAFDVAGMKTTGGLLHRREHRATQDASVVAKLKREGAIILGKTNTPTLCFCQETDNKLYGRSNNPWDLARTTGGSSGGEAALIAVGGAALGIGSDIGGSIRFPAHFNGVVGFRSGNRQVPQQGHFPFVENPWQERMLGIGALAKSVADAELLNMIIADHPPKNVDVDAFEVVMPPAHPRYPLDASSAQWLASVRDYFSEERPVADAFPPFFEKMALWWQLAMSVDGGAGIASLAYNGETPRPWAGYIKEIASKKTPHHRYLTWALIGASLFQPSPKKWSGLIAQLKQADAAVAQYLANRVLVLPVYHSAALHHGGVYGEIFSVRRTFLRVMPYVAMVNVFGLPALTVPVGTDENGMPVAVQLVAAVGNEQALFHVGRKLEKRFRGYVRCKAYDQ